MGAIDGTHINIRLYANGKAFFNRENRASLQLQVVCDHDRKFMHVYAGQVGTVHDARVLRLSGIKEVCNDDRYFSNNSFLLGDSSYPIREHLLVPFKDNGHLDDRQNNYNKRHSSARIVIE